VALSPRMTSCSSEPAPASLLPRRTRHRQRPPSTRRAQQIIALRLACAADSFILVTVVQYDVTSSTAAHLVAARTIGNRVGAVLGSAINETVDYASSRQVPVD
jgi:hypothetical protein